MTNSDDTAADEWREKYEVLQSAYSREKKARKLAEKLLEDKARDLYFSNDELKASLETLKQAQSQLVQSEKMASVGLLAAGVAHEINNPIAYVSSNLEVLADYAADIKVVMSAWQDILYQETAEQASLEKIRDLQKRKDIAFISDDLPSVIESSIDGVKKVRKIVSDLSEFSALNTPESAEVDMNELLDRTINLAWNELKYNIELDKSYDENLPVITARSGKLGQVFLNLIINAAHAMEKNPPEKPRRLSIKTSSSRQKIMIWISDTGHGIPTEKLSSIFDPFFTTKAVGKGTGLGLHISQNIILKHDGSLRVVDSSPKGTTFEIILPIVFES